MTPHPVPARLDPPAYPDLRDPLDRRRFLAACARAVALAGTGIVLGGGRASGQQDPDAGVAIRGEAVAPDWPQGQVRLVNDQPFEVTFRDGRSGVIVVAVVIGAGPEPVVDPEALLRAVREACLGFDSDCLRYEDARRTLEAQLQARLDELLKAWGSSIEAVSVVPVLPEPSREDAAAPRGAREEAAPAAPREAEAEAPGRQAGTVPREPSTLPRPQGRCLIHGDGPCPPYERRD